MICKRLAVIAYFRAPMGGLQENIRATVLYAIKSGWSVIVLAPPGPFLKSLVINGINTQPVAYGDNESEQAAVECLVSSDVIHAHPGPSRHLALRASEQTGVPVIFTIHGRWMDNVETFISRLDHCVCVSESILESALLVCPNDSTKLTCIPNGVDLTRFSQRSEQNEARYVAVASRFDEDKRRVVDLLRELWSAQASAHCDNIEWRIAGSGTLMPELVSAASTLETATSKNLIAFLGWQDGAGLSKLYSDAYFAVAPGRCAMEALSVGIPTVAVGSGGVVLVSKKLDLVLAARSNFGGFGTQQEYCVDTIFAEIKTWFRWFDQDFSRAAASFIRDNLDNEIVNRRLIGLYDIALH